MFDTMTVTKAAAGLFGTFLVLLLAKWGADVLYSSGGHGHAEAAYIIETESSGESADGEEVVFEDLLAAADVEKGARVFRKCTACHKLEDGANGTGPYLYAVVDRPVASAKGFTGYSASMQAHGGNWTPEALDAFLERPSAYISGTSMSFAGLKKPQDRADVIAYLQTIGN
ncbi:MULTISPECIES: cytochrome c family protein [unclassified Ruegeria]|uniref:c-type cytochrome n=1 Tax=unclassified Ruegeria TaxID=2625375 RepID=UPI0014892D2D|nr:MULTISPECIES: cytochrome c family protein [unclassified Ruegeria]NOD65229.1 c-type cytochrome [Ruegeria sp. HKCCD6109]NOD78405.1 c-type cytochrome [Ruegeria sp. HKCCD4332]NOD90455.1 c-type cytochrome [Ruegeria sp. HKCCD4318]NOD94213.1 c-type cytochrome [Ruegeria sp. HKCCD4884]NOE15527.1 c-type cytochrome [Ruegeria sp. HKCCD4318-2]